MIRLFFSLHFNRPNSPERLFTGGILCEAAGKSPHPGKSICPVAEVKNMQAFKKNYQSIMGLIGSSEKFQKTGQLQISGRKNSAIRIGLVNQEVGSTLLALSPLRQKRTYEMQVALNHFAGTAKVLSVTSARRQKSVYTDEYTEDSCLRVSLNRRLRRLLK